MTEKETLYRAIVIDPEKRTIEAVVIKNVLKEIHELIGTTGVDNFRIADHEGSWDYGWCNDTGLSDGFPVHAFLFSVKKDPVAGRCVLIGVDKDTRDSTDAKFDLDILRAEITWLGVILPEVTWEKTDVGERAIVTYAKVKA